MRKIINHASIVDNIIINHAPIVDNDEMYDIEQTVVKVSSQDVTGVSEVVRVDRLPRLKHQDLFTEFDNVVLRELYEDRHYDKYDTGADIDFLRLANSSLSTMTILNPKPYYNLNDVIYLNIEVMSGYNKRIFHGSDRVFVWVKEPTRGACASGYVVDHRNGSYTGVVQVLWSGRVDIVAGIALSREAVRVLYKIHREGFIVRQLFAIFQRRFMYEMTLCFSSPYIPGYSLVCNLTARHDGLPWYCGHPDVLTCAEWTRVGASQPPWPLSDDEHNLFAL